MWYEGALLDLVKKMKPLEELEKEKFQMLIYNNKQLASFIGSIEASYVWLFSSLYVLVKTHKIPSVGLLTKSKPRNQVRQRSKSTWSSWERFLPRNIWSWIDKHMHNYIGGLVQVRTMLFMLQTKLKIGSKTLYPDSMETRVRFERDTIK